MLMVISQLLLILMKLMVDKSQRELTFVDSEFVRDFLQKIIIVL